MNIGKRKCELLKSIRREIAEKYDLQYNTVECTHEGDCMGTCSMCDAELSDLQRQLDERGIVDVDLMPGDEMRVVESVLEEKLVSCGEMNLLEDYKSTRLRGSEIPVTQGIIVEGMPELPNYFKHSDYSKTIKKRILFKECAVAGVGFRDVDWEELDEGVKLVLVRHRDNKYDKNAVAVVLADDYDEKYDDFDFDFILGYGVYSSLRKCRNSENV